jgi:hypothetical protein
MTFPLRLPPPGGKKDIFSFCQPFRRIKTCPQLLKSRSGGKKKTDTKYRIIIRQYEKAGRKSVKKMSVAKIILVVFSEQRQKKAMFSCRL